MHCCNGFPGEICIAEGNYHSMSGSAPTLQSSQQRTLLNIQFWMAAAPYGELQLGHGGRMKHAQHSRMAKIQLAVGYAWKLAGWVGSRKICLRLEE